MKRKYLIRPVAGPEPPAPPTVEAAPAAPARFPRSRREMIAEAAYYRAQRRGFAGGSPEDDWIAAEAEIEAMLAAQRP